MNGAQAIHRVLSDAMGADARVHLLGEALPLSPAGAGLMEKHTDQVHLLPAADATLTGVAVGMAIAGHRPVVELASPAALWGALQQLGQEAAAITGEFSAPVVFRVPITNHGFNPVPLLSAVPGLSVACASTAEDAVGLLQAALTHQGPTVLLESPTVLAQSCAAEPASAQLGQAKIVREGAHISLLCWGAGVAAAEKAANILGGEGISAEVIDLRSLAPLDAQTIGSSVQKTGRALLIGTGAQSLLTVIQTAFLRLESPPIFAEAQASRIVEAARGAVHY
jgi:pyruvate dehydrogenase E1 component beta subunit